MKRLFWGVIILLPFMFANAQKKDITYKVTNYEIDGINYDSLALNGDVALHFYNCGEKTACFANHWRNNDSQSYGTVSSLEKREFTATSTTYAGTEIKFIWHFSNTYDDITGNAAVTIRHISIDNKILFTAEIVVLEDNKVLLFKGYLE